MNPTTTALGSIVTPSAIHTESTFQKMMAIMAAIEPIILAGAAPFIKSPGTQLIVASEAPLAQNLFSLLSQL